MLINFLFWLCFPLTFLFQLSLLAFTTAHGLVIFKICLFWGDSPCPAFFCPFLMSQYCQAIVTDDSQFTFLPVFSVLCTWISSWVLTDYQQWDTCTHTSRAQENMSAETLAICLISTAARAHLRSRNSRSSNEQWILQHRTLLKNTKCSKLRAANWIYGHC